MPDPIRSARQRINGGKRWLNVPKVAPDRSERVAAALADSTSVVVTPVTEDEKARYQLRKSMRRKGGNNRTINLVTLPGVQPLSAMLRYIDGGRARIIELVQLAVQNNEPALCQWWDVFRDLPTYTRQHISLDDVCAASNVSPKQFLMILVSTAIDFGQDVGNLAAAALHPHIVERLIASAERIDGTYAEIAQKDRHAFLQARSFLPAPRGAQIYVHASAQAAAAASAEPSVPSFAADLGAVPTRQLPSATPPPVTVETSATIPLDPDDD